jgi:HK97 family phage prohead protease
VSEVRKSARGETRRLTVDMRHVELRAEDAPTADVADGKLILKGHAAVFDRMSEDLGGFTERIARGAFRKALDRHDDVRLLVNHDGLPLARTKNNTLELREDPKGLHVYAELADTQMARDLRTLIARGDVDQMSFGFTIAQDRWDDMDGAAVRTIMEIGSLFDVSAVTYPAYTQTDVSMRAEPADETDAVRSVEPTSQSDVAEEEPAEAVAPVDEASDPNTKTRQALMRELHEGATRRLSIARTHST